MSGAVPRSEFVFTFARSSGPGGQNVNKVNTKCVLRWNVRESTALTPELLSRFLARFGGRLTFEGELVVSSDTYRSQKQGLEACVERVQAMVESVRYPPRSRTRTRPTRSSRERRLESKRVRGQHKAGRGGRWGE